MTPYFKSYSPASPSAQTVISSTEKFGQAQLFSWHPANATAGDSFFDVPGIDTTQTQHPPAGSKRKK